MGMSLTDVFAGHLQTALANMEQLAVAVTLQRGEVASAVRAICLPAIYSLPTAAGVNIRKESQDWLVPAADYDFGGGPVLPARNDRFVHGSRTYVVTNLDSQPCYGFEDQWHMVLRVHTQLLTGPA